MVVLCGALPWVPLSGTPYLDLVLVGLLVTLTYWPVAHVFGLTGELKEFVARLRRSQH